MVVSLFNAIRATRLAYLQKKHPTVQINEVRQLFINIWCREIVGVKVQLLLTLLTVFLCIVNTSDNKTLPEGGIHGENWPNSQSTTCIYYKTQMDVVTFDISDKLI